MMIMRIEREMMQLILGVARRDERVRAVLMNGSRTNPNVPKDCFQDYDVVYLVTELESFLRDHSWVDVFGERMIMQMPEAMGLVPPLDKGRFTYLMQFMDGNRIDLSLLRLELKDDYLQEDKLTVALLDKDNRLPEIPPPSDEDYWVKPPTARQFADCCNEFWWVSPYVAKGLWRQELIYAKQMLDLVRDMLLRMLEWQAGINSNFSLSVGKGYKYLDQHISPDSWNRLLTTYAEGSYQATWEALFAAGDLFRDTAQTVAAHFNFTYPLEDDRRVSAHLRHVRALPQDAEEMYSE
jgi:aminoglycoside 6-adenylyltransferase